MAGGRKRTVRDFVGVPRPAATGLRVRGFPMGLHRRPAATRPHHQTAGDARSVAIGLSGCDGPAVCTGRPRAGSHARPVVHRCGRPLSGCRHHLGRQRPGLRPLPHATSRGGGATVPPPARRPGRTGWVRRCNPQPPGDPNGRRDGAELGRSWNSAGARRVGTRRRPCLDCSGERSCGRARRQRRRRGRCRWRRATGGRRGVALRRRCDLRRSARRRDRDCHRFES